MLTGQNPRRWMLLLVAVFSWVGCGSAEPQINHEEFAFKHGPGPGPPYNYVLTTFSGEGTACGKYADGKWYYSTGEWMFRSGGKSGCGTKLKVMANGKCVVVEVADNGPAAWVEAKAQAKCGGTGYVLDVSPLVSNYLFGVSGSGWSDCRQVQVWVLPSSTKTGPVPCTGASPTSWTGGSCQTDSDCIPGKCLTSYPNGLTFDKGMCTEPCTKLCPDMAGHPDTFCVTFDATNGSFQGAAGHCFSQCDTSGPVNGCRTGYTCTNVARHNDPGTTKDVCLPVTSQAPDAGPPPPDGGIPPAADASIPPAAPPPAADLAAPGPEGGAPPLDGGAPLDVALPPLATDATPPHATGPRGFDGCAVAPATDRGDATAILLLLMLLAPAIRRRLAPAGRS